MNRRYFVLGLPALLAACATGNGGEPDLPLGPDGQPLRRLYRLTPEQIGEVQFRMLDGVNALRVSQGLQAMQLNAALNAAAATHARDMAIQNRPWHFGSDGSSPIDRVRRVGYQGTLIGETISETFESELETLAAWLENPDTRGVIMDPRARDLGFAWFQEELGKIWWTMVVGAPGEGLPIAEPLVESFDPAAITAAIEAG
ncbi:MAG: CAP domain-containing protein [Pseudomonadota bacterium]